MPIFLTGFMGSGKSHTGREVAAALGIDFVDLDDEIERTAGRTIAEIFDESGEAAFRDLEAGCLREQRGRNVLVATGGGAPCFHDGMAWMNENGTTVFLDPSEDILVSRLLGGMEHRPLLSDEASLRDTIREKMALRRPIYERAQLHFQYAAASFDVTKHVLARLRD